jgi:hypothetical protein
MRVTHDVSVGISSGMGTLTYDSKLAVSLDDRVLAHLQVVIWSKLRRGEHFSFTWTEPSRSGFGRTSIWLAPSIPLTFEYFGGRQPRLNAQWVQILTKSANSPGGLVLTPEPPEKEPPTG